MTPPPPLSRSNALPLTYMCHKTINPLAPIFVTSSISPWVQGPNLECQIVIIPVPKLLTPKSYLSKSPHEYRGDINYTDDPIAEW